MAGAGHDFMFMWSLAYKAYTSVCKDDWVLKNFSPALMIAISWEETQFNNIRQTPFNHTDWMKRWTELAPDGKTKVDPVTKQVPGNHAIGYVQAERDTIDRWLALNPKICVGLPGFTEDMAFVGTDKGVTAEQRQRRTRWWQNADEAILKDDDAGFSLGWRAFSHMHTMKAASTKAGALKNYGGSNAARDAPGKAIGRTAPEIIQGWLDTDACMRAIGGMQSYQADPSVAMVPAMRIVAGAYYFSRPDGDFAGGFWGTSRDDARATSRVFDKYLKRGASDSFIPSDKIGALRADLKANVGIVEKP